MIEQIIIIVLIACIGISTTLIGVVIGQHSVWKYLRKKGHVRIDNWYYKAVNVNYKEETTR